MNSSTKFAALVLIALLLLIAVGLLRTSNSVPQPLANEPALPQTINIDQTPLMTAQRLAQLPTAKDEQAFAEEALRLGDHEMDLAFAAAVREAEAHPPELSAEGKEFRARLQKSEDTLAADQARVAQLSAATAKATGAKKDQLEDAVDVAKANQELDQDEVDDAKQDLIRTGQDPASRIQEMIAQHEAASKVADSARVQLANPDEGRGLIHRFQQWSTAQQKNQWIAQGRRDALTLAAKFSDAHNKLDSQLDSAASVQPGQAAVPPPVEKVDPTPSRSRAESRDLAIATRRRASNEKGLANFDKRIDDQKQIAQNYEKWSGLVIAKQQATSRRILIGFAIILSIALIGLFFDTWLERLLGKTVLDRRRVETLRGLTRVSVQIMAVLLILLVIFGPPSQLGTFLGLAGAGLTVALKDFIVGFIGWFVLMGKNGIRLGDWIEINGVSGEVVELGMFHTVLLETGNWTDSGHPTGRRVTFTNSFAIEGHFFNFSTSGQWLWDELQVVLPAGQDPYPVVDALHKTVLEVTATGAQQAELEWQGAARSRDMRALSAAPAINVKPVIGGVEIAVRYIVKANERYQVRAKLNSAAVELLGRRGTAAEIIPGTDSPALPAGNSQTNLQNRSAAPVNLPDGIKANAPVVVTKPG